MNKTRNIQTCLFFLLSIFVHGALHAQDYRLVNPARVRTYAFRATDFSDSIYYFIKVDSVRAEGSDTLYYFNRYLDTVPAPGCLVSGGDTLSIGARMLIRDDAYRTHVFFNSNGDSIFIRTLVQINDNWHVYNWPDGRYVKGTVISKLYLGILPDVSDSLCRIKLSVYDAGGTALPGVFPDDTKMDFTKDYGLVEFWPFAHFPDDTLAMLLRGITDPDSGVVDVSARRAFDFGLGDEFHYRVDDVTSVDPEYREKISAIKYFVLHKYQYADSVRYDMVHVEADTLFNPPSAAIEQFASDTVSLTFIYAEYGFLDSLEFTRFHRTHDGFSDFFGVDSQYYGIPYKKVYDWFSYDPLTGCLNNPDNIRLPELQFGDGLGTMHYFDSTDAENYYHLDLVYFHKGLLEWGTPYDFSFLAIAPDGIASLQLAVYPNPAKDAIHISLPETSSSGTLTIYDLSGRPVIVHQCNAFADVVHEDISHLLPGYYTGRITVKDAVYIFRFVKE